VTGPSDVPLELKTTARIPARAASTASHCTYASCEPPVSPGSTMRVGASGGSGAPAAAGAASSASVPPSGVASSSRTYATPGEDRSLAAAIVSTWPLERARGVTARARSDGTRERTFAMNRDPGSATAGSRAVVAVAAYTTAAAAASAASASGGGAAASTAAAAAAAGAAALRRRICVDARLGAQPRACGRAGARIGVCARRRFGERGHSRDAGACAPCRRRRTPAVGARPW